MHIEVYSPRGSSPLSAQTASASDSVTAFAGVLPVAADFGRFVAAVILVLPCFMTPVNENGGVSRIFAQL